MDGRRIWSGSQPYSPRNKPGRADDCVEVSVPYERKGSMNKALSGLTRQTAVNDGHHPNACNEFHNNECPPNHGCNGNEGKCPSGLSCRLPGWRTGTLFNIVAEITVTARSPQEARERVKAVVDPPFQRREFDGYCVMTKHTKAGAGFVACDDRTCSICGDAS